MSPCKDSSPLIKTDDSRYTEGGDDGRTEGVIEGVIDGRSLVGPNDGLSDGPTLGLLIKNDD